MKTLKVIAGIFAVALIASYGLPYFAVIAATLMSKITAGGVVVALVGYFIYCRERTRAENREKWAAFKEKHFKKKKGSDPE